MHFFDIQISVRQIKCPQIEVWRNYENNLSLLTL